ncbi:hypothetical protein LDENG_00031400, partial [Lucifuga dentata]
FPTFQTAIDFTSFCHHCEQHIYSGFFFLSYVILVFKRIKKTQSECMSPPGNIVPKEEFIKKNVNDRDFIRLRNY